MSKHSSATLACLLGALLALMPAVSQSRTADAVQPVAGPVPADPDVADVADVADVVEGVPGVEVPPADDAGGLTGADVGAWLDGFLPYAIRQGGIPGAVVVVVKDGEVLVSRGYGHADVEARTPVDPATTLFRPGSVSKLFTWTAVMQLVEQGKLDLDADINTYLDFQIPERNGAPVTLRNVLTHTTGMEEAIRGLIIADPTQFVALDAYLKHWVPTRIFDAGTTPAYSNYATALAGYVVERASGQSFDDYIEQHIFAPLGMRHASFRQPLPEALQPLMAKGYAYGEDAPKEFEFVTPAPAGSLSASGEDMARFMIAHLQDGAYRDARILEPATAQQMHGTALDMLPPLNRMLLGFYEYNVNDRRVIAHAGDTQWFHSDMPLFIDDGVGVFVSFNSAGREGAAGKIRGALHKAFAERYLPGKVEETAVDEATAREHAAQMAGLYDSSRRPDRNFLAILNLVGQTKVVATEDGSISVPALTGLDGLPVKWKEVAPYVWRDVAGSDRLAAQVVDGKVVRWSFEPVSPFTVFEPVPWWRSAAWLLPLVGVGIIALALTVLTWPISALVRRHYGVPYRLVGEDARAHRIIRIASLVVLVTVLGVFGTIAAMFSSLDMLGPANDGLVRALRIVSLVVFPIGALVALWNAWQVLRSRRRIWAKLWAIVLAAGCVAILWMAVVYHLVGYSANY